MDLKYCPNFATIKSSETDADVIVATASSGEIDRDGEIIVPGAFADSLNRFVRDGAILACHQHRLPDGSPPMIGRPVFAKYTDQNELEIGFRLGKSELARKWRAAKDDGTWRAVSVGFQSKDGEFKTLDDQKAPVYHHIKAELFEVSGVPVGSNREALLRGLGLVDSETPDVTAVLKAMEKKLKTITEIGTQFASAKAEILAEVRETIEGLLVPDAGDYADYLMTVTQTAGEETGKQARDAEVLAELLAQRKSLES